MDINDHIAKIYAEGDLLLGSILSFLPKSFSTKIQTAAISLDKKTHSLALLLNDQFFSELSGPEVRDVLRHEAMHVAFSHLFRINDRDHKRWNIATDMFINQNLRNLPDGGVTLPEGWTPGLSADEYYILLEENPDIEEQYSSSSTDDHSGWEEIASDPQLKDDISSKVSEMAERSMDAGDKMGGVALSVIPKKPSRKWAHDIRRMFDPTEARVTYKTNRFDKRRTYHNGQDMIPARVNKPHCPKIYVAIDVSGSLTKDVIEKFSSEVNDMSRYAEIECIVFDHGIQSRFPWKHNMKIEVNGQGGTDFQPVFDTACSDSRSSGLILLTDGFAHKPEMSSKIKTLWVLTKDHNQEVKNWPGKTTELPF